MTREELFKEELDYIQNDIIRSDAKYLLSKLPEYFFHVPAASTGKYHPKYAQGEGGLVRHTKAAIRFAKEILNNSIFSSYFTKDCQDVLILALLLHDGFKKGKVEEKYVRFDHPLIAASFVEEEKDHLKMDAELISILIDCIKTHMGPFTKDYFGHEVLEKPTTKYQLFVHLCDDLSSKKCFSLNFDEENHIVVE